MKCNELKSVYIDRTGDWVRSGNDTGTFYLKPEVDAAIDKLKTEHHKERHEYIEMAAQLRRENAELKAKLENAQASAYADSVDAGMRERRLRRSLYKACANWSKCEGRINNRDAYEASEYLPSAEDKFRKKAERWSEMETKCRAKAESYL